MNKLMLFQNLVQLAAVDGKFTEEEVNFLALRAEQWGIPDEEFDTALAGAMQGAALQIPGSAEDRRELMGQLVHMMAIDGELAEAEKRMCATASARMGFTAEEFAEIVDSLLEHPDAP